VSTLTDKTAPTRSPHFQLENGSRNSFSWAIYSNFYKAFVFYTLHLIC